MNDAITMNPTEAGRGSRIGARVLTVLLTCIWVFFGIGYLTGDHNTYDIINHHLGYPLYIIPFIGLTHILGGLGLLIPNRPRLTEWVFAGLTYDLLLAAISHIRSYDVFTNALHPLLLLVVLAVCYELRRRTGENLWSSRAVTPGRGVVDGEPDLRVG